MPKHVGNMQDVIDGIVTEAKEAPRRNGVVIISASDLAEEFGVAPFTATKILRLWAGLEYDHDGDFWYEKAKDDSDEE